MDVKRDMKSNSTRMKRYRCLVFQEKQSQDIYLTHCGMEKCLPGYTFRTGQRTGYHLHVITSGRGELSVNGEIYPLHQGQMFITKPGGRHLVSGR